MISSGNGLETDVEGNIVPADRDGVVQDNRDRIRAEGEQRDKWMQIVIADFVTLTGDRLDAGCVEFGAIQKDSQRVSSAAIGIGAGRAEQQFFGKAVEHKTLSEIICGLAQRKARDDILGAGASAKLGLAKGPKAIVEIGLMPPGRGNRCEKAPGRPERNARD